ncbi:uncharacterized protein [Rutidosis leptorrhynchoides]|uniref:uncharacterized protein isoform X2 n=1 Tax=Rutidosis leptorrhynchoides TaxID=125765 RepID=UPI003A992ED1
MARDRFDMDDKEPIRIKLIGSRDTNGRTYNLPTANEVAALIIGDIDGTYDKRDIILEHRKKGSRRISELHTSYLALQYPLLFPYAEDGYRVNILHRGVEIDDITGHAKLTLREFFAYRLQMRVGETSLILMSRALLQQFIVDVYTMVENTRLNYIRNNQKAFRIEQISNLLEAQDSGNEDVSVLGNRIMLPSSFTGGARYMYANYMDAMAIVRAYGSPDLFITLTCNPKCPEIMRVLTPLNQKPEDRPDIISRVFKIKLDALYDQIRDEKIFAYLLGGLYVIEFQKRGLPHVHMCLFLDKTGKISNGPTASEIDNVISAEIPDKDEEPELYELVSNFMIHGPCGTKHLECSCMKRGRCSKHFPKDFTNETHFDVDGFPLYKRRDDGKFIMKKGEKLDNRNVVGYNKSLLKQYQAHMNIEWCNQVGSIKYLFKYMNKCPDRISIHIQGASQFIEWMKCNQIDHEARQYTYVKFPRHYVWKAELRKWTKRIMLNKIKGATSYEDLRTVDGTTYNTFKEVCYAMGLLDDDK